MYLRFRGLYPRPWELYLQVMGQPIDDFGTPTLVPLTFEDFPADRPVEKNQLRLTAKDARSWESRIRLFRARRSSG